MVAVGQAGEDQQIRDASEGEGGALVEKGRGDVPDKDWRGPEKGGVGKAAEGGGGDAEGREDGEVAGIDELAELVREVGDGEGQGESGLCLVRGVERSGCTCGRRCSGV